MPHTFTTTTGREYRIRLTVGEIDRIRSIMGIDLAMPHEPSPSTGESVLSDERRLGVRLMENPVLLATTVFHLAVKPDSKTHVPSDDAEFRAFLDALDGEKAAELTEAFFKELSDFFRRFRPHVNEWLEAIHSASRRENSSSNVAESSEVPTPTDGPSAN